MLIRISLIVALVAALAVGILNFVMVKEKIETVEQHRADEQKAKEETQLQLAKTTKDLKKTAADLKQTQETLATTTTERDKAVADAAAQTKRATELNDKLAKTTTERDEARQELSAFKATGRTPEQILSLDKIIKQTEEALEVANLEKKILDRELRKTQVELAKLVEPDHKVRLPADLKGRILVADPKWDFVVLDFGEDKQVLVDGELLVNRNGKLVAKVRIQSIQKDRCIANVMPGWKLTEVMEGDQVIPAYPAS
jgi:myosin heavy subunit